MCLCWQTVEAAPHCPSLPPLPNPTTATCSSGSRQRAARRLKPSRRWGTDKLKHLPHPPKPELTACVPPQFQAVHIGVGPPLLLPRQEQGQLHLDGLGILPRQAPRLPAPNAGLGAAGRGDRQLGPLGRCFAPRSPHSGLHKHQHRHRPARLALRDCRPPDRQPGHQLERSRAGLCPPDHPPPPTKPSPYASPRGGVVSISLCWSPPPLLSLHDVATMSQTKHRRHHQGSLRSCIMSEVKGDDWQASEGRNRGGGGGMHFKIGSIFLIKLCVVFCFNIRSMNKLF